MTTRKSKRPLSKQAKKNTRGGSLVEIFGVSPMKPTTRSGKVRRNGLSSRVAANE